MPSQSEGWVPFVMGLHAMVVSYKANCPENDKEWAAHVGVRALQRRLMTGAITARVKSIEHFRSEGHLGFRIRIKNNLIIPIKFWQGYFGSEETDSCVLAGDFSFFHSKPRFFHAMALGVTLDANALPFIPAELSGGYTLQSDWIENTAADACPRQPRLPDSKLIEWWNQIENEKRNLPLDQLWALSKDAFPQNHIARDRIRALEPGRKPGPKPISDNRTA